MRVLTLFLAVACGLAAIEPSQAAIFVMQDRNSEVSVDSGSQAGMYEWLVGGNDQIAKQWFWIGAGNNPEQSLDTLTLVSSSLSNGNADPLPERLSLTYAEARGQYEVIVDFVLTGGSASSGVSDVAEIIRIRNTSQGAIDFRFYQYVDLDLLGTPDNDVAQILNSNAVGQTDGVSGVSETVIAPRPTHYEVALYPTTLDKLNDGLPTTLSDAAGPVFGNATWAFEWDFRLGSGGTYIISKDKRLLVPEPGSAALAVVGLGLAIVWAASRRTAR